MSVSVFGAHSLVLQSTGKAYGFGCNKDGSEYGWLGVGSCQTVFSKPTEVKMLSKIEQVSTGAYHSIFLDEKGQVHVCGINNAGQCCPLTPHQKYTTPELCTFPIRVITIQAGGMHSLCIDEQRNVWGMGKNHRGQLGLGFECKATSLPEKSSFLKDILQVSCGFDFSMALNAHDQLFLFGDNSNKQLASNSCSFSSKPILFEHVDEVYQIEAGYRHCLALTSDGIWSWGYNNFSQLGFKSKISSVFTPRCISVFEKRIINLSAGHSCSGAIDEDGDVWIWGCVDPTAKNSTAKLPEKVKEIKNAKQIYCSSHVIVVGDCGTLWAFGKNNLGQLGIGNTKTTFSPTQIVVNNDFDLFSKPILGKRVFSSSPEKDTKKQKIHEITS